MKHHSVTAWLIAAALVGVTALPDSGYCQTAQTQDMPADHSGPTPALPLSKDMVPPAPIYKPEPPYSPVARNLHIERTVTMMIIIGTDGRVTDVHLTSKPMDDGLDQNAQDTVRTWKFRPATLNGRPVMVRVLVQVTYRLFDLPGNAPAMTVSEQATPLPLFKPDPEYTDAARQAKLEGTVTLEIMVDKSGRVTKAKEIGPKLGMGLDKQAIKTVRTWKFRPATRDGKTTEVRTLIRVTFKL